MKKQFYLFLLLFSPMLNAQINPIGFRMNLQGKVEIITKNNLFPTSQKTDSVLFICKEDSSVFSRYEFSKNHLTFMDLPDENWTNGSLIPKEYSSDGGSDALGYSISQVHLIPDTNRASPAYIRTDRINTKLQDEIIFHGDLTPELKSYFKNLLDAYIFKYKGVSDDDDNWDELGDLLIAEDTVESEGFVYPAMVDKMIFYNYDEDKLSTVSGFYFNFTAVERDSLVYDSRGNLIYFHRESVGSGGERMYFKYNTKNQLIEYKSDYYDYHSDRYDPCPSCKVITEYEYFIFEYDEAGYIKSKNNKTNEFTPFCFIQVKLEQKK